MGGLEQAMEMQITDRLQNLKATPMTANDLALKLQTH